MFADQSKFSTVTLNYLADLVLVWVMLVFYFINPYYANYLSQGTRYILFGLAFSYTLFGWVGYYFRPTASSKVLTALKALRRLLPALHSYFQSFSLGQKQAMPTWNTEEKVAILFLLVKIFFIPLLLNFAVLNYLNLNTEAQNFSFYTNYISIDFFNTFIYPISLEILFFIDTAFFCFGYLFEADFLDNKVRSVEPTWIGWMVALICYPPFNEITGRFLPGYNSDYPVFADQEWLTVAVRVLVLVLILVYTWASVALGPKASNLTNRGIVQTGPYRFVRHPAYISKNLAWFLGTLPVFGLYSFLSSFALAFIYYLRAVTEERHLIADPDYQAYCKKVKYKFIPRIY
jgi:hypothetical protein